MRRFFLILLIVIIPAMLLFSVFNANRAYAGTCSAPTQSQLLGMTTGTQVYNALDCVSQSDLNNLLDSLTHNQLYSVTTLMNTAQLDSVMGILNSDQIGYLIYPFTEPQLNTFLTDLGAAETYNFIDNITANPPISQAQLVYDVLYPLLNVSNPKYQDLVNLLTSIGQYNGTDLYNILNILNVSSSGSSGSNYLYDILYPLSNDQLYSVLSLLTPTQLLNLLSLLNKKDLYHILTKTLSSTDLYNLFLFSGPNYSDFQSLISNLKPWQKISVWIYYWLGEYIPLPVGGNADSTKTHPQPKGSAKNDPGSHNPFPSNGGGPGIGNQPPGGGGGGTASPCNKNSAGVYNCNINITITTQAPNEPPYSQSGGVSVTVANPH